jgi:outer membrane protein
MFKVFSMSSLFVLLSAGLVWAADSAGFRLAVVDFQKAINSIEEGKAVKAKLQKEADERKKDLSSRQSKLEKMQKELEDLQKQAQSGLLKPEQTASTMEKGRKLEADFRKDLEAFTQLQMKSEQEFREKESKALQGMIPKLKDLVQEIGRTEGFTLVMESNESGLFYAASYTDITEKLIQRYNSKYKP